MSLLHKIISKGNGNRYYRITNADGKSWLLPAHNMRVALNLYQPSGRNGKLLKALFPWLHHIPFVRKAIKAETICCTLCEELKELLQRVFECKEIEFAIFEGTPCVHQKITIQLSCGKKILGYCKASDNSEILALFERETAILSQLAESGVTDIPQPLYCGTMSNGVHIFIQSTAKTTKSQTTHTWGVLQERFLAALHEKTKQLLPFEDSDYYRTMTALQEHIDWLPANIDREVITTAIARVMAEYSGKMVEFSACHGDFTPWNMFVECGKLFVFDFEYAARTYPAGIDRCHFEIQTMRLEQGADNSEIVQLYKERENPLLTKYLLSIIAQYTMREKGVYDKETMHVFELWARLLEIQENRI